nr:nuclear transport factor 2 family protein [Gemmatimonadota bacterium]NIQ57216.1 nuclear transport factor 2 family protein [Gemmatimonadota bacterium]NIU77387.1 DUF4440 domain-containing protein [Gammaproteobacteria bacterium]NIX46629.1 DUF4440 domain-containing protein [Gemmatimonadota bacterium]NIY10970.1 DUF4440 domain-containing protein [Gemmatimonadota bacterium]
MIGALITRRRVARAFDALNRRDITAFMAVWAEDAAYTYPADLPVSGTHEGRAQIETWFRRFLEQFPEMHVDVQHIVARRHFGLGATTVAFVEWTVDVENRSGFRAHNRGVTVMHIRGGRYVRVRD